jgi:hypothetical protein
MPVVGPGTEPSPDGSLLGWLAANYPDTYNKLAAQPHDTSTKYEPSGSALRRKKRIKSPTTRNQDAAARPVSTRTRVG